jgi:His/Glu/Gln/Arg/opine family amino acid ABC transporter permease subunit
MDAIFKKISDTVFINLVYEDRYKFLVDGFLMNLRLTVLTFLLGTAIGALFCWLRFSGRRHLSRAVEQIKTLFTRLPTLVLLIIFAYMIFKNTKVDTVILAILALGIKAGSYISDIMYSAVSAVDKGEVEAARTLGMSRFSTFRMIILPQAIANSLSVYKNQLIITLQETSLVGFLAINDLTRSSQVISSRTMNPFLSVTVTALSYLLIGGLSGLLFNRAARVRHLGAADIKKSEGRPE